MTTRSKKISWRAILPSFVLIISLFITTFLLQSCSSSNGNETGVLANETGVLADDTSRLPDCLKLQDLPPDIVLDQDMYEVQANTNYVREIGKDEYTVLNDSGDIVSRFSDEGRERCSPRLQTVGTN